MIHKNSPQNKKSSVVRASLYQPPLSIFSSPEEDKEKTCWKAVLFFYSPHPPRKLPHEKLEEETICKGIRQNQGIR